MIILKKKKECEFKASMIYTVRLCLKNGKQHHILQE